MAKKLSVKAVDKALRDARGNISHVAREMGVSRSTLYRYITDSASLRQTLEDAREEFLDIAEDALMRKVNEGDTASIIFALKTRGKDRGYVERMQQEVSGKDGGAIRVVYENRPPHGMTLGDDDA